MSTITQEPTGIASMIPPGVTSIPSSVIASMASAIGLPEATVASMASAAISSATAMATSSATAQTTSSASTTSTTTVGAMQANLNYHGIHPYNPACDLFFSITGFILQIAVLYAHSGISGPPNVPVLVMSFFYLYMMLSFIIAACHWHSDDPSTWWNGSGWCDLDVRATMAISIGILATQCVINYNILDMLKSRPRLVTRQTALRRSLIELACCLALPILNLTVSTFFMNTRYFISQDIGCSSSIDSSVATIVVFLMWFPILGAVCLFTLCWIVFRFYKRGNLALETIQFLPNMNVAQLFRMLGFAAIIAIILVPLSICTSILNFISMHEAGIHAISWAHGKPKGWSDIIKVTLLEMQSDPGSLQYAVTLVNYIVHYVNIAIAWLLFICYGTGSVAIMNYKRLLDRVNPWGKDKEDTQIFDKYAESFTSYNRDDSASIRSGGMKKNFSSYVVTTTDLRSGPSKSFPAPSPTETVDTFESNMRAPRPRLGDFLKGEALNKN